jgi:competence protein ComEC
VARIGGAASGRARGLTPATAALARQLEAEHDRWFLWLPVLFGAGIAVYFVLAFEPLTSAAVLPAVAALALHAAGPRAGLAGLATGAVLAATLGVAAAKLRTEAVCAPVLQERIGAIDVYGHVELIEPRATGGQRITLRVTAMEKHEAQAWPERVRVRMGVESAILQPGDHVRVKATLSPPPGPALPGDYDFARAAWFMGLGAVGFSRSGASARPSAGGFRRRCRARRGPSPTR